MGKNKVKKLSPEDRARREARRVRRGRPKYTFEELRILGHELRERRAREESDGEVYRDHGEEGVGQDDVRPSGI